MTSVPRAIYLDAAKVISACLVVYWHTVFNDAAINALLSPIRMPLFFLVSGFFARKAMLLDWQTFVASKFLRLIYPYVIWSVILYLTLEMLVEIMKNQPVSPGHLLAIFVDPPRTIWFLYALALAYLIGYLTWPLPRLLVIAVAFALYFLPDVFLVTATEGDLIVRLCRLVPFFLVALRFGAELRAQIESRSPLGMLCVAAYLPAAIFGQHLGGLAQAILFLGCSAIGIFGLLNMLWRVQDAPIMHRMAGYGSVTIFIFLLHRYTITVFNFLAARSDVTIGPWTGVVVAALAVVVSVVVGRRVIRPYLPFLERPLWRSAHVQQAGRG